MYLLKVRKVIIKEWGMLWSNHRIDGGSTCEFEFGTHLKGSRFDSFLTRSIINVKDPHMER